MEHPRVTRQRLLPRATLTMRPAPKVNVGASNSVPLRFAMINLIGRTIEYLAVSGATMVPPTVGASHTVLENVPSLPEPLLAENIVNRLRVEIIDIPAC